MDYFVYIIYSQAVDQFYKGVTKDINHRLFEHNNEHSRHTAGKGPWELIFLRKFHSKTEALVEERRIKRLNRHSLLLLIHSDINLISH